MRATARDGTRRSAGRTIRGLLALAVVSIGGAAVPAPAGAETVWLCRPGAEPNPCELSMDTTVEELSGETRVERPEVPANRPVDCFYVYPTVSNQRSRNADRSKDPEVVSIAKYQAARFSLGCRVFAPMYRQVTLLGLATGSSQDQGEGLRLAFSDVREAWLDYLANHNGGRGVVLIGHSQGTRMLRQLVRTEIDRAPTARRRLVSALLIGGNATVRRGQLAGGDFEQVPLCTRAGQFGCTVAYSTFPYDPPPNARYGRTEADAGNPFGFPTGPEYEVACTDPWRLSNTTDPLRLLVPSEPYAPGPIATGIVVTAGGPPPSAPTTWVVPRDRWTGGCLTHDGVHVLRYEPVGDSRRPNPYPDPTWGSHLIDVNLTLDKLVEIVRLQSARYLRPDLRLTRRCVGGGRLRVGVRGDREVVEDVRFALGMRPVGRAGPAERTIGRRALRRTRASRLRAVVRLRAGARSRVVLERSLPRCARTGRPQPRFTG